MSVDLTIAQNLGATPTAVADQNNNLSGLFLTNDATGSTNIRPNGKLVFGLTSDGAGGDGEWIQNSSNGSGNSFGISFFGANIERMRITNDGKLGIGTTVPSATLHVNGGVRLQGLPAGAGADLVADVNGNVFVQSSSERFKENIRELKDDFSKILSLNPVSFQFRQTGETAVGYLAEDVQNKDLGNLVSCDAEGNPFSVHYKLIPVYLLEVLKQQQKTIREILSELSELKGSRNMEIAGAN